MIARGKSCGLLLLVIAASLAGQTRSIVVTGKVEIEGARLSDRFHQPLYGRTTMSMIVEPIGSTRALAPVMTDGTIAFRVPRASVLRVSMTDLPFGIYVKSITAGSRDLLNNLLELSDPRTPAEIKVMLTTTRPESEPRGFTVRGRAVGPLDLYPEGLELRVGPARTGTPQRFERIPIPRTGSLEIRDVPPGTYRWEIQSSEMEVIGELSARRFTVTNADVENLEIPIPFRMSVRGRIQADNGDALQLTLRAMKQKGLTSSQFAKRGLIDMRLQEGSYTLEVSNPPAGYAVTSITYGSLDLSKSPLIINRDTPISELRVVLTRTP